MWTVLLAFAASLASWIVLSVLLLLVLVVVVLSRGGTASALRLTHHDAGVLFSELARTHMGILGSVLASCLSFAFMAVMAASLSPMGLRDRLRLRAHPWWFACGLVAAVGMLGIGSFSSGVIAHVGLENTGALAMIHRAFAGAPLHVLAIAVVILGVGAGVGEELFFRGYVLTRLAQRWRPWVALVVSGGLFGLVHFDVLHSSFATLAGFYVGWVSLRTGSIRASIVAHVANNIVSTLFMVYTPADAVTPPSRATLEIIGGLVALTLSVLTLRRARPVPLDMLRETAP